MTLQEESQRYIFQGMIREPELIQKCMSRLTIQMFTHPTGRYMFQTVAALIDQNIPIELYTIIKYASDQNDMPDDLIDWAERYGSIRFHAIDHHITEVQKEAQKVVYMESEQEKLNMVRSGSTPEEAEAYALERMAEVIPPTAEQYFTADALSGGLIETANKWIAGDFPEFYETGFYAWDRTFGGLHPSDLVAILGYSSIGKSAFAIQLAFQLAQKYSVHYYSFELSPASFSLRIGSLASGEPLLALKNARESISADQYAKMLQGAEGIKGLDLTMSYAKQLSVSGIRSYIQQRHIRNNPVQIVFVDYLQPMAKYAKGNNIYEKTTFVVEELRSLATEMNMAIVTLSQVGRAADKKTKDRPPLAGRDSGAIEQSATIGMVIHRDRTDQTDPYTTLHVDKNTDGETGAFKLLFDLKEQRFTEA